jgi:hypothetical protein
MFENFYKNRNYGIYCQNLDRWVLIDNTDFWIVLETAKVLSSKIATTVYVLPDCELNNDNCMNYMLIDKTSEKRGVAADLITSQLPTLKILSDINNIAYAGTPEDYNSEEGKLSLKILKEYITFSHKYVTATMLCNIFINHHDNKSFSKEYIPKEWVDAISTYGDRTDFDGGILSEIRRILYLSNTIKEAKYGISNTMQINYMTVPWIINNLFNLLGEKNYFNKDDKPI